MKASLLLICLLGFLPTLFAQKEELDYAVSNQGDTVWGRHRSNLLRSHILETDSGKVTLKASDYKLVFIREDSAFFRSMRIRGMANNQWCERIENGRIQLYSYLMSHGQNMTTRQIYAVKGRTVVQVFTEGLGANKEQKKEELKRLIDDNPEILSELEKTKGLRYKTVLAMVKKYNAASIR